MKRLRLGPLSTAKGEVQLPGSKSLSNRALLLAALAEGETRIRNLLDSDDTQRMREALQQLGVGLNRDSGNGDYLVRGLGGPFRNTSSQTIELYLGNAGTAVRPLTAALCLGEGEFLLRGDARMYERPIADLTDALMAVIAGSKTRIEFLQKPGYLPLKIHADGLPGGEVRVRGDVSSQFLTALLMSAPLARRTTHIRVEGDLVSKPYVRITLQTLAQFGVKVHCDNELSEFTIEPQQLRAPAVFRVEGDASSASYLLAAAAIAGGPVRVHGIGQNSVQGDVAFVNVLAAMGAEVRWGEDWVEVRRGGSNRLRAIDMDLNHIPDAAMTVATLALFADGTTHIRNIWNWRVKETDRLAAMATELRKLGAQVHEARDALSVTPPVKLRAGAVIDTYEDHRIAMAFSLAALGGVEVNVNDPDCVNKTFPEYWSLLAELTGQPGRISEVD